MPLHVSSTRAHRQNRELFRCTETNAKKKNIIEETVRPQKQ